MIKDKDESGSDPNQLTVIKEEPLTPENIKKETDSNDHKMNIEDECSTSNSKKTSVKQTNNFSSISANSNNKNNVPVNKKESLMHDSLVSDNDLNNIIAIKTEDNSDLAQDSYSNISNSSSHITQTHVPLSNQQAPPQLPQSQTQPQQQQQQQQQAPPQLTPENIQPLPSNIINRQTNNIEVQYMQQQSQIFVFSTLLANKGAEAVLQGHFHSIIAYHCAQPGTKKFLEKNPLKINQFNRPTSNTWINNIPMNRPKNCLRNNNNNSNLMPLNNANNNHKRPSSLDGLIGAETLDDMVALSDSDLQWDQKNNAIGSLDNLGNGSLLSDIEQSTCMLQNSNVNSLTSSNQMLSNLQPSLQGVKVPDENLTPQQRQHREEQLATIRKMHQMLFPEHQSMNLDMTGLTDNQESNDLVPANISNMLDSCTDNASDKDAINSLLGGIMPSQRSSMNNMMPCSNPHQSLQSHPHPHPHSHSHSQPLHPSTLQQSHPQQHHPPPPLPPPHSQSSLGQLEWKKLQNQFFDERKMKSPQNIGKNGFPNTSNIRMQGPPPPYHQTTRSASVPIALQSPNPVSPINSTSNISLPSPRASSAVNSPSTENTRTFPPSNKPLSQQHKSPNTNNNSQDSPTKLLNQSNPSTPISSHLSPNTGSSILEFTTGSMNSTTTTTSNSNGMYNHSLSQKQNTPLSMLGNKEANLMPVPSPQQISYLNTFDGQELTIQKQPNTSLKDGTISTSPMEESLQNSNKDCSIELEAGSFSSDNCQFSTSSPQLPTVTTLSNSNNNSTNNSSNNNNMNQITSTTTTTPTNASNAHETYKTDLLSQSSNNLIDNSCYSLLVNDCNSFTSQQQQQQQQTSGGGDRGLSPNQVQSQQNPQLQPNFSQHHSMNKNFIDIIPPNNNKTSNDNSFGCMRTDNVPLNPNSSTNILGNSKVSHFDPISSLAQMSQLLTNTPTSSMNNQQPNNTNMMMFNQQNSVHNMMNINDLSNCHNSLDFDNMMPPTHHSPNTPHQFNPNTANQMQIMNTLSPKIVGHLSYPTATTGGGGTTTAITTTSTMPIITSSVPSALTTLSQSNAPRMIGRPVPPNHPFNGTNVQVKPNAPNTIQYLPAKPQIENQNPRGPPSLDFLHRFTNPVSNMDSKMPTHNMQYFPPCNAGPNNMNHLNNINHMDGSGPQPPPPPPAPQHMTQGHMMSSNENMMMSGHPCRNNMLNQSPMNMNINMIRNAPPMRSGPGGGPVPPAIMTSNPMMRMPQMNFNQLNNLNQTDVTQPLPPSMNQNNFKNSHFIGPTISDPNYAQQFHNFQQQLYATTTNRNPMNNSIMNSGPHNKF